MEASPVPAQQRKGWSTADVFVRSSERKPDAEGTAFARRTLGSDVATELLHQGLCDRETQSRPLARAGTIGAIEALEDVWQIIGFYADTRVTYPQHGLPTGSFQRDDHTAHIGFIAALGVLEGIIEQDEYYPAYALFIPAHAHWRNRANIELHLRSLDAQPAAKLAHQLKHSAIKFDRWLAEHALLWHRLPSLHSWRCIYTSIS